MEDYKKAEQLHRRSLAIREKVLGTEHPDVAGSLDSLAGLYLIKEEYDKALPLIEKALLINEKVLGAEHPNVASSLDNLAEFYLSKESTARRSRL